MFGAVCITRHRPERVQRQICAAELLALRQLLRRALAAVLLRLKEPRGARGVLDVRVSPRAAWRQVHARNKAVDPTINWAEVARAMAGFTGADCMGLMQRAARMAARQVRMAHRPLCHPALLARQLDCLWP